MAITIQMGENPKPTCMITLASSSFSNGTATATFDYSLDAMSGYSYWGYGVKLEYGSTSSLGSSVTIVNTSPSQWSTRTGSVTITKTGVSTSPQSFYFRLNAVSATAGTPGSTSSYSVDFAVDRKSDITGGDFGRVERSWSVNFTTYGSYYHRLICYAWRTDQTFSQNTQIVTYSGVSSGQSRQFTDAQILSIYNKQGIPVHDGTINIRFVLETYKSNGGAHIGDSQWDFTGYFWGTGKIRKNSSSWQGTLPFVRISSAWKPCLAYININGTWKRCSEA